MKSVYLHAAGRPAIRPAGRFTRKVKAKQSRADRRQAFPSAEERVYDTHHHAFTLRPIPDLPELFFP